LKKKKTNNMKTILFSGIMLLVASVVSAQKYSTTYDRANTTSKRDSLETIANALAEFAIQNIGSGAEEANAKAAEYSYKLSKTIWLNNFTAAANINEFTIHGRDQFVTPYGSSLVYPRYNFGVVIPFGIFINNPKQTQVQYYKYKAEEEGLRRAKENYKLQVLAAYYTYVKDIELQAIQGEALQDAEFAYKKTEEQFGKGQTTVELYTLSGKRYNTELVNKTTLETDTRIAKAQLEALLGMSLESAMSNARIPKTNVKK
jgi:outer membrane protein TolC